MPARVVEVRKLVGRCGDSGEPVVEDDMELGGDVPGLWIEDERDGTCMFVGEAEVDGAS